MARIKLKNVIVNFTPSFFSINMGTGILSILLQTAPHQFYGEKYIGIALYFINIALFLLFLTFTICRNIMFPWVIKLLLRHPTQCMFIGTLPMGLATIVNATVLIVVPAYGDWAKMLSFVLWWIDVALTAVSVTAIPMLMFEAHKLTLQSMTAAWLLPIVPAVVAAASGGLLATVLPTALAKICIVVSFVLWGIGLGLSILILALYLHRIMIHSLPNAEVIVSAFLPLGPMGQGAYGIIQLGKASRIALADSDLLNGTHTGEIIGTCANLVGLMLWGFSLWWVCHGILSVTFRALSNKITFNMGFWGFVFPIGTFTAATIDLGDQLNSSFFNILSLVVLVCLVILYLAVTALTLKHVFNASLPKAPCLGNMDLTPTSEADINNNDASR
jgi:C4-dicarboxylate transporter/malic acid transport protein